MSSNCNAAHETSSLEETGGDHNAGESSGAATCTARGLKRLLLNNSSPLRLKKRFCESCIDLSIKPTADDIKEAKAYIRELSAGSGKVLSKKRLLELANIVFEIADTKCIYY